MKVSLNWLKQLINLKVPVEEVIRLLSLRTIGIKEVTEGFIELDMKGYNRADLLSIRGVAREVAAITDSAINFPDSKNSDNNLPHVRQNVSSVSVEVQNPKLCPVYCIAKIEGLKVNSSNSEWVKKLEDSGIRSINNVADVTNLIMLEFGQPMHAFDIDKVAAETLVVRLATQGETLQTLDGKNRNLDPTDLLIADLIKPLGIAGVMGGKDTEVSDSTTSILLEAAIFDPISVRRTGQRHGLHSEASKRFQHGLTKTNLLLALNAAIKMYESLGGKLTGLTILGDLEDNEKTVTLTQKRVNSLIGVEIPKEEVELSLKKLGFSLGVVSNPPPRWEVTVPYWRLDINIEEDLVEEVARMYGYEKIPANELQGDIPEKIDQTVPNFKTTKLFQASLIYDLKVGLANAGLTEIQTYSFYSSKTLSTFNFPLSTLIKIANPISSETEYLRDNLWPNLVEVVGKNLRNSFSDIAIFEVGKVYLSQKDGLPKEIYKLAVALMNGSENPAEKLTYLAKVYLRGENTGDTPGVMLKVTSGLHNGSERNVGGEIDSKDLFHPTRFAYIKSGEKIIGYLAEVHPRILDKFGIEKRVAILEVEVEPLIDKLA